MKEMKRIRITRCEGVGRIFGNITSGSEHVVIDPPAGKDDKRGVWVMGVGEPVLVLHREFYYV